MSGVVSFAPGEFQSAGRIWGFWNYIWNVGMSELTKFQSAGRIWGFWNTSLASFDDSAAGGVSIRRADLGLLERVGTQPPNSIENCFNPPGGFGAFGTFSSPKGARSMIMLFQSAGRIWGFWNHI